MVKVVRGPPEWGACSRTAVFDPKPLRLACWKDTIAVGLYSKDIIILDGITGCQTAMLSGHTNLVNSIAFSSDGTLLVSGSHDTTVKLWDMQTGGVIKTFHGHTACVWSVSISANCTTIASGSGDWTICLWDIQTGECHCVIKQQDWVGWVGFSPIDPQHLISVCGSKVWQWNTDGHQINPTYEGYFVAFSPDGTQFASCYEKAVTVRNTNTGEIVVGFHVDSSDIGYCCFSPDSRLVAVGVDSAVYVWDITGSDPHIIETLFGHQYAISDLKFSSPSFLISSSHDKSIKFWQIGTLPMNPAATVQKSVLLNSAPIMSITLQAEDGIAISRDSDGMVKTWDISTGLCKASFQTPAGAYNESDIRLIDGRLILVWWVDEKIHIWDVERGELLQMMDAPWHVVNDVGISVDGSKVFYLLCESIQVLSIWTGEVVGKVEFEFSVHTRSLTVDGSRVWVHHPLQEPQGWDFAVPGSPIQLSNSSSPHLKDDKLWDTRLHRINDAVTGKVVFQLSGRFAQPIDSQWDGQYLAAGYDYGEVLILDFNYMLL